MKTLLQNLVSNLLSLKKYKTKAQLQNIFVVTAEGSKSRFVDMTHTLQCTLSNLSRLIRAHLVLLHQIFSDKLFGKSNTILLMSKSQDSHSPVTIVTELDCNHFVLNRREEKNSSKCFVN